MVGDHWKEVSRTKWCDYDNKGDDDNDDSQHLLGQPLG